MQKRMAQILSILLALALLPGLAGCGLTAAETPGEEEPAVTGVGSEQGQALAEAYAADQVFSLNASRAAGYCPLLTTNTANLLFLPLVYDTVFTVEEDFTVSSEIITQVTTEDYVWWTFKVDTGIRFHDGSTLTARDVTYSIQRAMGSAQYRERLGVIYGISALDEETFAISTAGPRTQLTALLNIPVIKYDSLYDEFPPGTGPYQFNEAGDALVAFPQWHRGEKLPVDTIYLKEYSTLEDTVYAYKDSLLDLVVNDPTGVLGAGYGTANEVRYCPTTNMHYLGFNETSPFFRYTAYRYGVIFAVDRARIVSKVLEGCGLAASTVISPASVLANREYGEYYAYSRQKARNCYNSANVRDYDDDGYLEYMVTGIPMEINLNFVVCADSAAKVAAAEIIAADLEALGLRVTLRALAWEDYVTALEEGDFDLYYGEVKLTAEFDVTALLTRDGSLNYGGVTDPAYETALEAYLQAEEADRPAAADALCKLIIDTAPIVPICFERRQVLTHRGVVSGVAATQYNVFHRIEDWTINLEES